MNARLGCLIRVRLYGEVIFSKDQSHTVWTGQGGGEVMGEIRKKRQRKKKRLQVAVLGRGVG